MIAETVLDLEKGGGKEDRRILVLLGGRRPMVRGRQARKEADSHLSQRAAIC